MGEIKRRLAVGGTRVAVPPERIVGIVRLRSYTPLPSEDAAALGVAMQRNRVIARLDLGLRLGIDGSRPALPGDVVRLALDRFGVAHGEDPAR